MLANLKAARDKADAEEAASAPAPKASASKQGDLLSQLKGKYGDDEEDEEAAFAALTGSPRRPSGSPRRPSGSPGKPKVSTASVVAKADQPSPGSTKRARARKEKEAADAARADEEAKKKKAGPQDLLAQLKGKFGDDEEDEEAAFAALTGSPRRGSPKATAAPSSVKKGKIGSFASDWEEPVHPLTDEEITSRMADRILRRRMADRDRAAAAVAVAAVAAERRKEEGGETGPLNASLGASQGAAADGDGNHSVRVQESARKVFQAWRRPFQGQSPVRV